MLVLIMINMSDMLYPWINMNKKQNTFNAYYNNSTPNGEKNGCQ